MLPSSSRRVVGRISIRATAAAQQQQREQQIRNLSNDNAAMMIICLIVIQNSSWWCSAVLRMELLSAKSHNIRVPDSIFRTQTKPECFGGKPNSKTPETALNLNPTLSKNKPDHETLACSSIQGNPGGKKEAHFWTTILGIMCHVSCSPPQLGTSARTSSRDQEFWVRDQCLRVLQFDKVKRWDVDPAVRCGEDGERGGGGGGDSGVDKYRSVRGVQHVRAVDCRRLKPTIAASITRTHSASASDLRFQDGLWIDITGRGIPRPCHPSKILRSNPAAPHLPSCCCATVSHKKRVRWSAKNPLLAEWNQAWLVGNAPQSRSGNKVETGEGEERKLWFLKKGFQLTLARVAKLERTEPKKQPKQAAQRGRSSDMG
ncbi:uncharacterized protein B0T23DRAFT_409947 [Neurospora hispaniola]|uniref:Uncharacterized protein n=1 Tax=Neurospora hispaniola TaxID=588809 RepID=A0AAJ0IGR0_9PEZI|nr:hypothetical protein B0T23DRAFT_409947 [Neurospora hispaniola]